MSNSDLKAVQTEKAPIPAGPYSQAVISKGFVFTAGQIGVNPQTGKLVKGVSAQTDQAMNNLEAILVKAGSGMDRVVRIHLYLDDMSDFTLVNDVYSRRFVASFPARSAVAVSKLPLDALIEIEAVATIKEEQH